MISACSVLNYYSERKTIIQVIFIYIIHILSRLFFLNPWFICPASIFKVNLKLEGSNINCFRNSFLKNLNIYSSFKSER